MSPEAKTLEKVISPKQTVDSFIKFNRVIHLDLPSPLDVLFTENVDRIFGNEELERIAKDSSYKGVEGAREKLNQAYLEEGVEGLKKEFGNQIKINTEETVFKSIKPFLDQVSEKPIVA